MAVSDLGVCPRQQTVQGKKENRKVQLRKQTTDFLCFLVFVYGKGEVIMRQASDRQLVGASSVVMK
jgi:hypothetical protein